MYCLGMARFDRIELLSERRFNHCTKIGGSTPGDKQQHETEHRVPSAWC
jgi:hypothetical protein